MRPVAVMRGRALEAQLSPQLLGPPDVVVVDGLRLRSGARQSAASNGNEAGPHAEGSSQQRVRGSTEPARHSRFAWNWRAAVTSADSSAPQVKQRFVVVPERARV